MSTSIQVNKKSVKDLLESGKDSSFVIPEYQRPYAWEYDQVETLFDDLWKNVEIVFSSTSKFDFRSIDMSQLDWRLNTYSRKNGRRIVSRIHHMI